MAKDGRVILPDRIVQAEGLPNGGLPFGICVPRHVNGQCDREAGKCKFLHCLDGETAGCKHADLETINNNVNGYLKRNNKR